MSETVAIHFEDLSKVFNRGRHRIEAVKNLNLSIRAGQVYGFLGPNGAGKTTTIRMLLNLIRPTTGRVYIYGQDVRRWQDALHRVGALVEDASFYGYLSGRHNLSILARTEGVYDPRRIDALLQQVGLGDNADRKVKSYSTGMKQRLGLAGALLNIPTLVILDEPTNGLDPAGIQEMRHFIRALAHEHGKTVFLSSHLLNEVEQICDRVAIINQGQLVREGAVAELLTGKEELRIEATPLEKAASLLRPQWKVSLAGRWLGVPATRDEAPYVIRLLVENGIEIFQVAVHRQSLEEFFLDATNELTQENAHA
jgi:ABC-2 type transport system ATP-binding protein